MSTTLCALPMKSPGEAGSRVKCSPHNKVRKSTGPLEGGLPSLLVFALSAGAALPHWVPHSVVAAEGPSTLSTWSAASRPEQEGTFHKASLSPRWFHLGRGFPGIRGN